MSLESGHKYTFEQELALRTDINLSLMANAGSGKTFVLVERFRKIINEKLVNQSYDTKIDTSSILAITFTKKAAAEMKKKVIDAFDIELKKEQEKNQHITPRLEQLKRIREGLTYANISTIHSFCSSLLRQFPIEAGIPVNFSEMSEAEKLKLTERVIDTTIDLGININQNDNEKENFRQTTENLLMKFGRKDLKNLTTQLLYKIELFDEIDELLNKSNDEINDKILKNLDSIFDLDSVVQNVKDFVKKLTEIVFKEDKQKMKAVLDLKEQLSQNAGPILKYSLDLNKNNELIKFLNSYLEIAKKCYKQNNENKKNLMRYLDNPDDEKIFDEYATLSIEIEKIKLVAESLEYLDQSLNLSRELWKFVNEVRETLNDTKMYLNELDFDDLQMKVKELLKNKDVVKKIRSQIDYIMIDEFQDTNQLQYNIVKALVPEIDTKVKSDDDINLFIVGDPKQSIYGFRNANVRVFYEAVDDIYESNKVFLKDKDIQNAVKVEKREREIDEEELYGKNRLTSTFRLRPKVASFVNLVCGNLMNRDNSLYEVDYTPLVCSKDTEKVEINDSNEIVENEYSGEVVFLLTPINKNSNADTDDENDENENNNDDDKYKEEKIIAQYIKKVVNDNSYNYKDIAILSRTKSRFSTLAQILTEEDIPFIIHSGNTFYSTDEITDFISFLKFIYNPEDDIALTAILRSPFFNLDDTKIMMLKHKESNKSLWNNIKNYVSENQEDKQLKNIHTQLNEILLLAPAMSITQVILMIIDKTGWMGLVESHRNKYQKIANIDKLIEIAREYEQTGFKNIYDFVEELVYVSENEILESEAAVITGENAVNIMTIHASKGLQFPVVILYNTNGKTGGNDRFAISSDFGPGFPLQLNEENVFSKYVDTPILLLNKIIKSEQETAEDKRILYVAMTRAEDILAISAKSKIGKNGHHSPQSQLKYIIEGLQKDDDNEYTVDNLFNTKYDLSFNTALDLRKKIDGEYKVKRYKFKLEVPKIFSSDLEKETTAVTKEKETLSPLILLKPIESTQKYERFSPSKFSSYNYNDQMFFDRYILGLPDELTDRQLNLVLEETDTPGIVSGLTVHYALELISEWLNDDYTVNEEKLLELIDISMTGQLYQDIENVKEDIKQQCINISKTGLIRNEFPNMKNSQAELYLSMPINENILQGYIDLLLKKSDGTFEVWDWKSNLFYSPQDKSYKAKFYELQMRIYTYLVSKLYPGQEKYTARLLFTRLAGENKSDNEWTHAFTWTKEELEKTPDIINQKIDNIKQELYLWLD